MRISSIPAAGLLLVASAAVVQAASKTFDNPRFKGVGVATCLDDARSACGQAAATKFCQEQKCESASSFVVNDVSTIPTFQYGDGKIKSPGQGGVFTTITCECSAIAARFDDPRVDGKPIDFCLRKQGDGGTDCGGPAADAFCKTKGYAKAASFLIKPDFPEPTLFLGDRQEHTAAGRSGFQYVECGN